MGNSISRREFLGSAAATAALAGCVTARQATRRGTPPNIVFIYTDDQAWWTIRGLGGEQAHTPALDALFAESIVLTNSFVTTPVCSPSRAGLLTSRYGTEVGITDWINHRGGEFQRNEAELGLEPSWPTWVRALRDAGYRTGLVGKWHLGNQDRYHPTLFGYDHFMGFREGGAKVVDPELEINGVPTQCSGLTVDLCTDDALAFLQVPDARPFVLSLHYREPHAPWLPVRDEDMAPHRQTEIALPQPDFPDLDAAAVREKTRDYFASVSAVDRNVARILDQLDAQGLRENTVVIFTSDNGYNIGHHGIIHKGNGGWITNAMREVPGHDPRRVRPNMWDNSLRVPTAIRWPVALRPGRVDRTIRNLDWFPTLLAMAGVELPDEATIHGRNFLPLLLGEDVEWDDDFYGEYSQHHYTEADLRMVRTKEWKLVRDFRNPGKDELYDLKNDPLERTNLIEDESKAQVRALLDRKLRDTMAALNDPILR